MDDATEISRIANQTGFSEEAVRAMADALRAGNGSMAQFNHYELGGFGQWSAGGMLMIGDMFNNQLKGRVGMLADQLAAALSDGRLATRSASSSFGFSGNWWPEELGQPSSSGAQNGIRYAVFPGVSRLAIDSGGQITIYDTGSHQIGGVSQQQGGTSSLRFTSQFGTIDAADLPVVRSKDETGGSGHSNGNQDAQGSGHGHDASSSQADAPRSADTQNTWAPSREEPPRQMPPREETRFASNSGSASWPDRQSQSQSASSGAQNRSNIGAQSAQGAQSGDPLDLLRRLASLRDEGILTEEEFAAKKSDILSRL